MDILTRETLSLIELANMDLNNRSVCSSSRRGGDKVKGVDGGIVNLASVLKVHKNLVEHPCNNISITLLQLKRCLFYYFITILKKSNLFTKYRKLSNITKT